MSLFKKKVENEYAKASFALNQNDMQIKSAVERIIFEELVPNDNMAVELVEQMKKGHPLIINFANLEIDEANKCLAFLSGATYALEGKIVRIKEKAYLFAKKQEFLDDTLNKFIHEEFGV